MRCTIESTFLSLLIFTATQQNQYYYHPYFTDEKKKVQRNGVVFQKWHLWCCMLNVCASTFQIHVEILTPKVMVLEVIRS